MTKNELNITGSRNGEHNLILRCFKTRRNIYDRDSNNFDWLHTITIATNQRKGRHVPLNFFRKQLDLQGNAVTNSALKAFLGSDAEHAPAVEAGDDYAPLFSSAGRTVGSSPFVVRRIGTGAVLVVGGQLRFYSGQLFESCLKVSKGWPCRIAACQGASVFGQRPELDLRTPVLPQQIKSEPARSAIKIKVVIFFKMLQKNRTVHLNNVFVHETKFVKPTLTFLTKDIFQKFETSSFILRLRGRGNLFQIWRGRF